MTRTLPLAATLVLLSACSGYEDEAESVDAVTQSEAEALDDAAAMIEQRRLPEGALPGEVSESAMPDTAAPQEQGGPEPMELPSE